MRALFLSVVVSCFAFLRASVAADPKKGELWITGDVFTEDEVLLFRADKPIAGNRAGRVLLLGATKQTANIMLPAYMKAAEKRMKLRLYGVLLPAGDVKIEGKKTGQLPNVQFITWKMHLPDEPDELPKDQKVEFGPDAKVPGVKIEEVKRAR